MKAGPARLKLNASMALMPEHVPPSAWIGHLPFAFWIVEETRPGLLVELGTHNGTSYLGFCQAVRHCALDTRCFAVDTWTGDEHSGFYGDEVYKALDDYNRSHYAGFSALMRMRFDEALGYFDDGSVDLLHIDGLHTYEAVREDFEAWMPKLSPHGVVLFHDTMVRERNFGVWKLWAELRERYPAFELQHTYGLGVLLVGPKQPQALRDLAALSGTPGEIPALRLFEALGARVNADVRANTAEHFGSIARAEAAHHLSQGEQAYILLAQEREQSATRLTELEAELRQARDKIEEMQASAESSRHEHQKNYDENQRTHVALIQDRDAIIATLTGAQNRTESELRTQSAEREQLHQQLQAAQVELAEQCAEREQLLQQLQIAQVGLTEQRVERAQLDKRLEDLQAQLTEQQAEHQRLGLQFEARLVELAEQRTQREQLGGRLEALQAELIERQAGRELLGKQLEVVNAELAEKRVERERISQQLAGARTELAAARIEAEARVAEYAHSMKLLLADKDVLAARLSNSLEMHQELFEKRIQALSSTLHAQASKTAEIERSLVARLASDDQRIRELQQQIHQRDTQIEVQSGQIREIFDSNSWKITAPIRWVLGLFSGK